MGSPNRTSGTLDPPGRATLNPRRRRKTSSPTTSNLELGVKSGMRSAGRLHDPVQGHEFTDDELAHDVSARLEAIPMKKGLQAKVK